MEMKGKGEWAEQILPWEKMVFQAHLLTSGSASRYAPMAANRLARGAGQIDVQEERRRLIEILQHELTAARQFAALWRRDRRC